MECPTKEIPKDPEPCRTPITEYEQSRDLRLQHNLDKMRNHGIFEPSLGFKPNPKTITTTNDNKTPRKRGRPRKENDTNTTTTSDTNDTTTTTTTTNNNNTPSKRGRPRKYDNNNEKTTHSVSPLVPDSSAPVMTEYEQSREERIRQNMEKMRKLGIFELSLGLKPNNTLRNRKNENNNNIIDNDKTPPSVSPLIPSSQPSRRSSRLKNVTPVVYSERDLPKKNTEALDEELFSGGSSRPEIYTEKHEKLLGSTEKSWTLFVDGYGRDGKRIYDQLKGKTCHQCRQKTLGYRTHCSECNRVQGQFCGDCLYMRYGEHVLEAIENPDWICPVCRGICNCSLCRQAKGWAPTGPFFKKITQLGFRSVAHYLIQTRRLEANSVGDETENKVSAKRSLAFSSVEDKSDGQEMVEQAHGSPAAIAMNSDDIAGVILKSDEKPREAVPSDIGHLGDGNSPLKPTPKKKQKQMLALVAAPSSDTTSGRLTQRRNVSNVLPNKTEETLLKTANTANLVVIPSSESIGGRVRRRRRTMSDGDHVQYLGEQVPPLNTSRKLKPGEVALVATPLKMSPKANRKLAVVVATSSNSIGGRLRLRRLSATS